MIDATDDPDQTNNMKVLIWQIYQFLEVIFKQLQLGNKLVPFRQNCSKTHKTSAGVQVGIGHTFACLYKQGNATEIESTGRQRCPGNGRRRELQQLPNGQFLSISQRMQNGETNNIRSANKKSFRNKTNGQRNKGLKKRRRISKLNWSKIAMGTGTVLKTKIRAKVKSNKVKTKHQLLEQERKLERKMKRTALENNDILSHSNCLLNKSSFNWNPKIKDVSDGTSRIDNLETPDRPTALIETTSDQDRFVASPNIKIHTLSPGVEP